jgi:hypothetical protein
VGPGLTDEGIGKLCRLPAGGWAIAWPGLEPVGIPPGEIFELEVAGKMKMKLARMERRRRPDGTDEWVAARGYELRDGLRAGFFDGRERLAKPLRRGAPRGRRSGQAAAQTGHGSPSSSAPATSTSAASHSTTKACAPCSMAETTVTRNPLP